MTERTLVLIKPDGVARRYVGEILGRIEKKGLSIAALELKSVSLELAGAHYAEHKDRPFFPALLEFISCTDRTPSSPPSVRSRCGFQAFPDSLQP